MNFRECVYKTELMWIVVTKLMGDFPMEEFYQACIKNKTKKDLEKIAAKYEKKWKFKT